jgi:hypothetical protein
MLALLALLVPQVEHVVLSPQAMQAPVRLRCPVNQTTRIVLPEAMRQLKGLEGATALLGLSIERTRPQGVLRVTPKAHPAAATVEFRGPTLVLRLALESVLDGVGAEVRLSLEPTPSPREEAAHEPREPPEPSGAPTPAPRAPPVLPTAPAAGLGSPLDLEGLLHATPVPIDRREGLPGQKEMVLVDALRGDKWIWLRFRLEGGAPSRIERVWWPHGDIASFTQEAAGRDLRVVVQVPRALVDRKTRVSLKVERGPLYKFPLRSSTLAGLFRRVFE